MRPRSTLVPQLDVRKRGNRDTLSVEFVERATPSSPWPRSPGGSGETVEEIIKLSIGWCRRKDVLDPADEKRYDVSLRPQRIRHFVLREATCLAVARFHGRPVGMGAASPSSVDGSLSLDSKTSRPKSSPRSSASSSSASSSSSTSPSTRLQVGLLCVTGKPCLLPGPTAETVQLKGVGARLIEALDVWGAERGLSHLWVDSTSWSEGFYLQLGLGYFPDRSVIRGTSVERKTSVVRQTCVVTGTSLVTGTAASDPTAGSQPPPPCSRTCRSRYPARLRRVTKSHPGRPEMVERVEDQDDYTVRMYRITGANAENTGV